MRDKMYKNLQNQISKKCRNISCLVHNALIKEIILLCENLVKMTSLTTCYATSWPEKKKKKKNKTNEHKLNK